MSSIELPPNPCKEALSAMSGDTITYSDPADPQGLEFIAVVITAGWIPSPKGGKVWTYDTDMGHRIPNMWVSKVEKKKHSETIPDPSLVGAVIEGMREGFFNPVPELTQPSLKQRVYAYVDDLNISPALKVSIHCLVEGDLKSLEVAQHLIQNRIRLIKELEQTKNNFLEGGINGRHSSSTGSERRESGSGSSKL